MNNDKKPFILIFRLLISRIRPLNEYLITVLNKLVYLKYHYFKVYTKLI